MTNKKKKYQYINSKLQTKCFNKMYKNNKSSY